MCTRHHLSLPIPFVTAASMTFPKKNGATIFVPDDIISAKDAIARIPVSCKYGVEYFQIALEYTVSWG